MLLDFGAVVVVPRPAGLDLRQPLVYPSLPGLNLINLNLLTSTSGRSVGLWALLASPAMSTPWGSKTTTRARHVVLALLAVLLTGCGGSAPGLQPDADAPSEKGSPSQAQQVEPADGPIVESDYASYHVPRTFEVADELADTFPASEKGSGRSSITLGEVPAFGNTDLGTVAEVVAKNVARGRPPKRVGDTTLAGEPAFHLEGTVQPGQHFTAYGAVHEDQVVYVRFDLDGSRGDSADLIESVLATWQWK